MLLRLRCAAPLATAVVLAVDLDEDDDHRNPEVHLRLPGGREVLTRHIRYTDSPGWAWPDQQN